MATSLTIAPSLGHSLVTAQGMAGGYDAIDDRAFWSIGLQEGVVDSGSFMVTERGAGANMTVDVACNTGHAVVQGDTVTNQGLYVVRPHPSAANLDIGTAHATLPRVDAVVVQIDDDEHDSSGNTRARVMTLAGTATAGATLDNARDGSHGGAAIPSNALHLADVLVPATDTSISNSQIRDRRKWARGAYRLITRNANAAAGNDYTTTSTSTAEIDATNLKPRIECSGAPIRVTLRGSIVQSTGGQTVSLEPLLDGASINGGAPFVWNSPSSTYSTWVDMSWEFTPSAGSHFISMGWSVSANTGTLRARSTIPVQLIVEELVRQNTANNSTTSG